MLGILVLLWHPVRSQQLPPFSQYMFHKIIINPAYTGQDGALSTTFSNRWQWVGVEGAPVTQTFSAHAFLPKQRIGTGFILMNDKIGVHRNLRIVASAAYKVSLNEHSTLSFGLQAGIVRRQSDYASITSNAAIDPAANQAVNQTDLSIGAGVYYIHQDWTAGLSIPELRNPAWTAQDSLRGTWQQRQYLLFLQRKFELQPNIFVEPSVLFKYLPSLTPSLDINTNVTFYEFLTTGLSYRTSESLAFLLRLQITPQLQAGYSYDYVLSAPRALSGASHELTVQYIFRFFTRNVSSPR